MGTLFNRHLLANRYRQVDLQLLCDDVKGGTIGGAATGGGVDDGDGGGSEQRGVG